MLWQSCVERLDGNKYTRSVGVMWEYGWSRASTDVERGSEMLQIREWKEKRSGWTSYEAMEPIYLFEHGRERQGKTTPPSSRSAL